MERALPRMVRTEEPGEGPGDRKPALEQSQQPGHHLLHFEAAQDKLVPSL